MKQRQESSGRQHMAAAAKAALAALRDFCGRVESLARQIQEEEKNDE